MSPIYGIVAQDILAPGSITTLPDPLAVADFANGVYTYGVTTLSASQVVNNTGAISGSGLHLVAASAGVQLLNQFRTKMFEFNWTLIFDLASINAFTTETRVLTVGSETLTFGYTNEFYLESDFGEWDVDDVNSDYPGTPPGTGTSYERFAFNFNATNAQNGDHIVGATRTNAQIAVTADGNTPSVETTPGPFSINTGATDVLAILGSDRFGNVVSSYYIRSLKIYDPVDNATLAALSA